MLENGNALLGQQYRMPAMFWKASTSLSNPTGGALSEGG
jgi:hypothetical protein